MMFKYLQKTAALVTLLLLSGIVLAEEPGLGDDGTTNYEFKKKKWKEQEVTIPALPKKKHLVALQFPNSRLKYFIDLKSISVGKKDRVARYTVVIESTSGVQNILYEAIRCHEKDYKTYAFSISGQPFKKMNTPKWRLIQGSGVNKYRQVLFDHFICKNSAVRYKAKDIIQVLKYPPENQSF